MSIGNCAQAMSVVGQQSVHPFSAPRQLIPAYAVPSSIAQLCCCCFFSLPFCLNITQCYRPMLPSDAFFFYLFSLFVSSFFRFFIVIFLSLFLSIFRSFIRIKDSTKYLLVLLPTCVVSDWKKVTGDVKVNSIENSLLIFMHIERSCEFYVNFSIRTHI